MSEPPIDDLSLARHAADGDRTALATVYERHADPLFAFVLHSLSGSRPDAEEVWQETLLAAVQSLRTYRGDCRLFTWLCSIARHKIADHLRRRRSAEAVAVLPPADLAALIDASTLPDEVLARNDVRASVVEALGGIPQDYREALVARYAEGRTVEDVARTLGKTYKAAESILSRAREAFRTALRKEGGVEAHE